MAKPTLKKVRAAMSRLGYREFDGINRSGTKRNYDLNIFGVRSANPQPNKFDDWIGVYWMNWDTNDWEFDVWPATTEPGTVVLKNYQKFTKHKGAAVLVPDQYPSSHSIGLHQGKYTALRQTGSVSVYRDANRDKVTDCDPSTIQTGGFGINIHRANAHRTSVQVDNWSAGCQVIANPSHFDELMDLCFNARDIGWGSTFSYTLLTEDQL